MAKRPAWSVQDDVVICENFDFMWSGGFSITQKQKNIRALHQSKENNWGKRKIQKEIRMLQSEVKKD